MELVKTPNGNFLCPQDPGEVGYGGAKRRSVTEEEAGILSDLAAGLCVLEIGTGLAVSTRALAKTALTVVTLDIDPWVQDPEIENVLFMRDRGAVSGSFDLAFIDGHHRKDSVLADIEFCRTIPRIVMHDCYLEDVAAAISESPDLVEEHAFDTRCLLKVFRWRDG